MPIILIEIEIKAFLNFFFEISTKFDGFENNSPLFCHLGHIRRIKKVKITSKNIFYKKLKYLYKNYIFRLL